MANRHLSRSIALQALFEWDFRGLPAEAIDEIVARAVHEFAPGLSDTSFIENLAAGVITRREALDAIIEKAAKDWPIAQTPIVDRNVLRIGLYELLFAPKDEVPARVAINEAIELAKTFGGEKSGKFVNGVLGTIYKEMGEPGKDDPVIKKPKGRKLTEEEKAKLPVEKLGGAVVYHKASGGDILVGLVHDVFGYWTLSKGHINEREDSREGTAREVKEEMSMNVEIEEELGANEYVASDPEKGKRLKKVKYYLARAKNPSELHLNKEGGLDDARWFTVKELGNIRTYDDIRPIIEKALDLVKGKK